MPPLRSQPSLPRHLPHLPQVKKRDEQRLAQGLVQPEPRAKKVCFQKRGSAAGPEAGRTTKAAAEATASADAAADVAADAAADVDADLAPCEVTAVTVDEEEAGVPPKPISL